MPHYGIGERISNKDSPRPRQLWEGCVQANQKLISSLREDTNSAWLYEHTKSEAAKGRMMQPEPMSEELLQGHLYHPRFVVEQFRVDGSKKCHAIGHLSWSLDHGGKIDSLNGQFVAMDKITHDTLDQLCDEVHWFVDWFDMLPHLFKVDVDSAYRRLPILPSHKRFCGVAFRHEGQERKHMNVVFQIFGKSLSRQVYGSCHNACPLGTVGSIIAWERIGSAILHIARVRTTKYQTVHEDNMSCSVLSQTPSVSVHRRLLWSVEVRLDSACPPNPSPTMLFVLQAGICTTCDAEDREA